MTDDQRPASDEQPEQPLEDLQADRLPAREVMSIVELGDGFSTNPVYTLPVEPRDEV